MPRAFSPPLRLLPVVLLLGCAETQPAPTSAVKVANAVSLRAFPGAIHLVAGGARAPFVGVYEGRERVAEVAVEGHATLAESKIARLEGGRVVALAAGEATLHVENELGAVDVPVIVHAAPPTALALEVEPSRIGEAAKVKATLTWAEGTSDATFDATYSTDAASHLHVPDAPDQKDWVAPLDAIGAILRAEAFELQTAAPIKATGKPPVGIEIRLAWSFLNLRRFGAFGRYDDGEEREVSGGCAWEVEGKPFRPDRVLGPTLNADQVSWSKTATCTLAGVRGSGSLFSP